MKKSNSTVFRSEESKKHFLRLYDQKRNALRISTEDRWLETSAGKTHLLVAGNPDGAPIILIHGLNAGAPVALEAIQDLAKTRRIYALDTIGQCGYSDETRLNVHDLSYGRWLVEVIQKLNLTNPDCISVSFGAYVLLNALKTDASKLGKAIFVVPSGFVNSGTFSDMFAVFWALLRYKVTQKEHDLVRFVEKFYSEPEPFFVELQQILLTGVFMDYRRPPELSGDQMKEVKNPIYVLAGENDVFFPAKPSLEKAKSVFQNFQEGKIMSGWKHVPSRTTYPEISAQLSMWLNQSDR